MDDPAAISTEPLTRSQTERLQYVEDLLFWLGRVGNADIRRRFDVSKAQAAQDIARYRQMQSAQVLYEPGIKAFLAPEKFQPVLFTTNFDRFLELAMRHDVVPGDVLDIGVLHPPARSAPLDVSRAVVNALAAQDEVEVDYVSMSSGLSRRWLVPHAFGHDGMRYHVRAFDHRRGRFGDFVMGRIVSVHGRRRARVDVDTDADWFEMVDLDLIPNPALSPEQRSVIMAEYDFRGHSLSHRVRRAMLIYLNGRMFLHSDLAGMPDQQKYRPLVPYDQAAYDRLIDHMLATAGRAMKAHPDD